MSQSSRRLFIKRCGVALSIALLMPYALLRTMSRECRRCATTAAGISSTGFCRICGAWADSGKFQLPSQPICRRVNKKRQNAWDPAVVPFTKYQRCSACQHLIAGCDQTHQYDPGGQSSCGGNSTRRYGGTRFRRDNRQPALDSRRIHAQHPSRLWHHRRHHRESQCRGTYYHADPYRTPGRHPYAVIRHGWTTMAGRPLF